MGRRGTSISLVGIFGLLAYLTSPGSPFSLANYIPRAVSFFGYFAVPTSWFILIFGFIPIGLGLLPEDKTEMSV